ncbi:MAG TPA: hypothetical protein VFV57_07955 [Limnobacter sp.]|nr:hypothetical protein [Limnobacter sp.]
MHKRMFGRAIGIHNRATVHLIEPKNWGANPIFQGRTAWCNLRRVVANVVSQVKAVFSPHHRM